MPSFIFHLIVAFVLICLGLFTGDAGEIAIALVFLASGLLMVGLGLYELDRD
jgi:hypothetical protein